MKYGIGDAREILSGINKPPATTNTTRNHWVAVCSTNKGNDAYFINGRRYSATGGTFAPEIFGINIGDQPSNWAVAFLATWNYHVGEAQLETLSNWLNPENSAVPHGFGWNICKGWQVYNHNSIAVTIGTSTSNVKEIILDEPEVRCPNAVSSENWISDANSTESFVIQVIWKHYRGH